MQSFTLSTPPKSQSDRCLRPQRLSSCCPFLSAPCGRCVVVCVSVAPRLRCVCLLLFLLFPSSRWIGRSCGVSVRPLTRPLTADPPLPSSRHQTITHSQHKRAEKHGRSRTTLVGQSAAITARILPPSAAATPTAGLSTGAADRSGSRRRRRRHRHVRSGDGITRTRDAAVARR